MESYHRAGDTKITLLQSLLCEKRDTHCQNNFGVSPVSLAIQSLSKRNDTGMRCSN